MYSNEKMDRQSYFSIDVSYDKLTDQENKIKLGSGNICDLNLIELDGYKEIKLLVKNEEAKDR